MSIFKRNIVKTDLLRIIQKIYLRVSGKEARGLYSQLLELQSKTGNESNAVWQESNRHLVEYSKDEPNPLNALSIFKDQWSSKIPGMPEGVGPGPHTLFDDERIKLLESYFSNMSKFNILELGPLEGGHSFMLNNKVNSITAIEGNKNAFLKCLIIKNLLKMDNCEFIYGDFTKLTKDKKYDLILAIGVLYHMENPLQLLEDISLLSDRVFFWTHYYEPNLNLWAPGLASSGRWKTRETIDLKNTLVPSFRVVRYEYREALGWAGFCGGPALGSYWVYKEDLLDTLKALGYTRIEVSLDRPNHANGPSFCVYAEKTEDINPSIQIHHV